MKENLKVNILWLLLLLLWMKLTVWLILQDFSCRSKLCRCYALHLREKSPEGRFRLKPTVWAFIFFRIKSFLAKEFNIRVAVIRLMPVTEAS